MRESQAHHSPPVLIDGVRITSLTGVVTLQRLRLARMALLELESPAAMFDLCRGVLAADPMDMLAGMHEQPAFVQTPVAFVVNEAALESMLAFAWEAALLGSMRRVFTDPAQALRWAKLAARLRQTAPSPPARFPVVSGR